MGQSSNDSTGLTNFFESEKKQQQLLTILKSWEGTPYKHKTAVKGKGVDCIHFVGRVMVEVGVLSKFVVPDYASDWHLHRTSELLSQGINQFPFCEEFDPRVTPPMNGDILLFRYGRAAAHATIYFDGYVWQALARSRVLKNSLRLEIDRLSTGFRIKK